MFPTVGNDSSSPFPSMATTVCLHCGDRGFPEALVPCATCHLYAIHRYCLDKLPPNFREPVTWFCEDCESPKEKNKEVGGDGSCLTLTKSSLSRPIKDPVWRGSLNILNKTPAGALISGFRAHLSNSACDRVREEAKLLPAGSIGLELFPRSGLWPESFGKRGPGGYSIALFFLPAESGGEGFDGLVREMIRQDLALRGEAADAEAEMLVFTSALLPVDYWMLGGRFYLWGVFREKKKIMMIEQDRLENLMISV